jgi:beta-alanine degradation protein BauB
MTRPGESNFKAIHERRLMDPTHTDPDKYAVRFENDEVRVLEYKDRPGARTKPHHHPNSVMITISGFERRLMVGGKSRDVTLEPGEVRWLDAQEHSGENIGTTPSHVFFVELKSALDGKTQHRLGPSDD